MLWENFLTLNDWSHYSLYDESFYFKSLASLFLGTYDDESLLETQNVEIVAMSMTNLYKRF